MNLLDLVAAMNQVASAVDEEPTTQQEEHMAILADLFTVTWLQSQRSLPKSQEELDALFLKAANVVAIYSDPAAETAPAPSP